LCSARRKRADSYIVFTKDQVHILPGYPKQISTDPLLASLAFYLQFPPGTSNADAISKDNLVSIVEGSIANISNAINGNISSVQTLVAETSTTETTEGAETSPPPPAEEPRTPSDEERSQSVELEIEGLNVSQVGYYFLVFL